MPDNITKLRTRSELASAALAEFIRFCRDDLTWNNDDPNFQWDAPTWRGVFWTKVGVKKRSNFAPSELLDPEFIDFAKAYYRYKNSDSPTVHKMERYALKSLEAALIQVTQSGSIHGLSTLVLDEAVEVVRKHYHNSTQYRLGQSLMHIAQFVTQRGFIPRDVSTWKNRIKPPGDSHSRIGAEGRAHIERKMPSDAALQAMTEIFANDPEDPRIRLVSAVWALLMSAPWRISEVLKLHVDAEYEGIDDNGDVSFGFRYYGAKGFQHDIKWVPTVMEDTAREAFRRIRELTQSARDLAAHMERHPEIPFRYNDCPTVGNNQELTPDEKSRYLRVPSPIRQRGSFWDFKTINEHWSKALGDTPKDFPCFDNETNLTWSNALFAMHRDQLHSKRSTNFYRLWTPSNTEIIHSLGISQNNRKRGILEMLGYRDHDGSPLKLTTHQARHYLNTIAERGAMAQDDLAKWSGRTNVNQNRVYNHMTEEENVERDLATIRNTEMFRDHDHTPNRIPVTMAEFNTREPGPIHKTEFGYCLHDWTHSPCDKFRDCLNCTEQVCVKGNAESLARIKAKVVEVQSDYDTALEQFNNGTFGADRWVEHLWKSLGPARDLLALMERDDVPDGTVVKLNDDRVYEQSHLDRAMAQRLPQASQESLTQKLRNLLENTGG